MNYEINALIQSFKSTIVSRHIPFQLPALFILFVFAFIFARIIRRKIRINNQRIITEQELPAVKSDGKIMLLLEQLILPVTLLFFYSSFMFLFEYVYHAKAKIIVIAIYFNILWIILTIIKSLVKKYEYIILRTILIVVFTLNAFDLMDHFIHYANEYHTNFGKIKFSLYDAIKVFITVFGLFIPLRLINHFIRSSINKLQDLNINSRNLLQKSVTILLYGIVIITVLQTMGIDMTSIAVLGGTVGIGIGLGLQRIAANFISGVIILAEKSIRIGDVIRLKDGTSGPVRGIYSRYVLIEDGDGSQVIIPNEEIINNQLVNTTFSSIKARIKIRINVAYNTDLDEAEKILVEIAKSNPHYTHESAAKKAKVLVDDFGDSSIRLDLLFWIDDSDAKAEVASNVRKQIHKQFKERGIVIPLPQLVVHKEQQF